MKKILSIVITAAVLVSSLGLTAFASSAGEFTVENGILIKYSGNDENVIIPSDMGITSIGSSVFQDRTNIKSITVPEGVTDIMNNAFYGCSSLTALTLPNSLNQISAWVFVGVNIPTPILIKNSTVLCYVPSSYTGYNIPNTVTEINETAFIDCNKLTSVTIPDSVTSIGNGAFWYCDSLKTITIPDSVTSIGDSAFVGTNIQNPILIRNSAVLCYVPSSYTSYIIPDTVTEIRGGAFANCESLTKITIPDNVASVGIEAFTGSGILDPILIKNSTVLCYVPSSYTNYTIPDTVTQINGGAFEGCTGLTSITIPDSVKYIGYSGFGMCEGLTEIVIPDSVTYIDTNAFWYCVNLKSITIPSSVSKIGDGAFIRCDNVTIYGASNSYAQTYAEENGIPFVATKEPVVNKTADAMPTASTVLLNGIPVAFEAYNIDGSNYFKLRDLAKVLSGTAKQFDVGYDSNKNAISLTTGKPYNVIGGELTKTGNITSVTATLSASKVYIDGTAVSLTAYNIGGSNYFKLRDVAAAINFGVTWNSATSTIGIDTSVEYTD